MATNGFILDERQVEWADDTVRMSARALDIKILVEEPRSLMINFFLIFFNWCIPCYEASEPTIDISQRNLVLVILAYIARQWIAGQAKLRPFGYNLLYIFHVEVPSTKNRALLFLETTVLDCSLVPALHNNLEKRLVVVIVDFRHALSKPFFHLYDCLQRVIFTPEINVLLQQNIPVFVKELIFGN